MFNILNNFYNNTLYSIEGLVIFVMHRLKPPCHDKFGNNIHNNSIQMSTDYTNICPAGTNRKVGHEPTAFSSHNYFRLCTEYF